MGPWHVYVCKLTQERWYVGLTRDVDRRRREHARWDSRQLYPFRLVSFEVVDTCSTWRDACDAEARWAQQLRNDGRAVINQPQTYYERRKRIPSPAPSAAAETESERLARWQRGDPRSGLSDREDRR